MSEWQDISTAPKDGTKVLCYTIKGVIIMHWHQPGNPTARAFWTGEKSVQPTHWMPLPEPPK